MRFVVAFIIACAAVVVSQSNPDCPREGGQCGGKTYTGLKCCYGPLICIHVNEWYSQCRGKAYYSEHSLSSTGSTTTTSATITTSPASCLKANSQCGGKNYTGITCCVPGSMCMPVNEWYSQCRTKLFYSLHPPSSIGFTTTATTTTTTSPRTTTTPSPSPTNPVVVPVPGGASGNGQTTRYWDCCKPSCGWPSNVSGVTGTAVKSCSNKGTILTNQNVKSGCAGSGQVGPDDGFAYMCTDNQPIVVNENLAYGFAAANIAGVQQPRMCCACYELTFTSGPVTGQKLIVQTTNTGGDLGSNHFDIQMPGGGLGIFDGCSKQFGVDAGQWGQRYGGITDVNQCNVLPDSLRPGCLWRFGWFKNADNPNVNFREVVCPAELTAISGCKRD